MNRIKGLFAVMLVLTLVIIDTATGQYWYYYMDGSQIQVEVYNDLITVRLDPESGWTPQFS